MSRIELAAGMPRHRSEDDGGPASSSLPGGPRACESATGSFQNCAAALARLHLRHVVTYQPASRYWPFQWYETGIFLALALILTGLCVWWVQTRRLS